MDQYGTAASEVLIRPLSVQLTKEADIDKVLAFEAEPLLPYPTEETALERYVTHRDEGGSELHIVATSHANVAEHLEAFQSSDVEPESVSTEPSALAAFVAEYASPELPCIVIHVELDRTNMRSLPWRRPPCNTYGPYRLFRVSQ